jgi:hypothetical protein
LFPKRKGEKAEAEAFGDKAPVNRRIVRSMSVGGRAEGKGIIYDEQQVVKFWCHFGNVKYVTGVTLCNNWYHHRQFVLQSIEFINIPDNIVPNYYFVKLAGCMPTLPCF